MLPFLALLLIALLWLDSARAREFAIVLAERHCRAQGLQMLDQTVALSRMGLRWTSSGLRLRRMFRFDFSVEGVGRRSGYVLMLGTQLESIDDGLDDLRAQAAKEVPIDTEVPPRKNQGTVVPFKRKDP